MPSYTQSVLSPNPIYLQTRTYDAKSDRKPFADFILPGVVGAGDFLVTLTSGMGISVAAGVAWIAGSNVADQGLYRQYVSAATAMTVTNNASGNPRLDQVILRVLDSDADSSGAYEARLEIVPGTPTGGATLVNRTGAANLTTLLESSKSVSLVADILVPAGAVSLVGGNLADKRTFAGLKNTFIYGMDGVTTTQFLAKDGVFRTPASAVIVATTVAGLGAGVDGKQGRLRLAGTPYEFIDLIYDATYNKWVSPAMVLMSTMTGGANQGRISNGGTALTNDGQVGMPNYKSFVDAGLKFQVRALGWVVRATPNDRMLLYFTVQEHTTAFDATPGNKTTWGYMIDDSSAGNGDIDGGWITDPNVAYAKPHVNLNLRLDNATAARQVEFGGSIWGRWTS